MERSGGAAARASGPGDDRARPRVSIGLAVRNGEPYLREALDSILAQTFTDFELIVSDNASTDATADICAEYAARDPRIRYHRNATNIGGARNENLTFALARGEYFRLAAHDDLCAPELLERCVEVLDADPSVVLCYTHEATIDAEGNRIGEVHTELATCGPPHERLRSVYGLTHDCEATYGLMRTETFAATDLQLDYTDSDRTLLGEMALRGRFCLVPETLFFKRIHPQMSTAAFPDWRARMAWFDPDGDVGESTPYLMQLRHYLRAIHRAPLGRVERARCYLAMVAWLGRWKRWRYVSEDVVIVARRARRRGRGRPPRTPTPAR